MHECSPHQRPHKSPRTAQQFRLGFLPRYVLCWREIDQWKIAAVFIGWLELPKILPYFPPPQATIFGANTAQLPG
jgi:hypothetical protein